MTVPKTRLLAGVALCAALIEHGKAADTPAAVVERATTRAQRVVIGTLTTLPGLIAAQGIQSPALIMVGDVVKLAGTLAWFGPAAHQA